MTNTTAASSLSTLCLSIGLLLGAGGCSGDGDAQVDELALPVQDITLDARRSLAVTEQPILERFSFQRVLEQLAADSGVPGLTSLSLFQ